MPKALAQIHKNIRNWYQKHGRLDLPWRNTHEAYHIYLSEVMLQQTQVKTVLERYYIPFIERFPTLKILGEAPLDEVLKMWEGLGYYNRAKNLHLTARLTEALPHEIDKLIKLPGIGKNTAHALAAFAFGQPVPIMEANVKRILCRLHRLENPGEKQLWQIAERMLDRLNPFDYNQAMMDIGATVCLPKNPKCEICPLVDLCEGKKNPDLYPAKRKRVAPLKTQNILVRVRENKLALIQRKTKLLHGLWGFESIDTPPPASNCIGEVSHAYTHFKLQCKIFVHNEYSTGQRFYFNSKEIKKLAISKIDEKILKLFLLQCEKD
ncbi:MAG: A/G-specific adenine glycosylase [Campylobacterota bacterium]|nr:A/G-specific adenine glycosylase [Campylobacterota bacterium]